MKERLGASGVQLGKKVVVEGQEIIEFVAASEGREDMVGKVGATDTFLIGMFGALSHPHHC